MGRKALTSRKLFPKFQKKSGTDLKANNFHEGEVKPQQLERLIRSRLNAAEGKDFLSQIDLMK